MGKKNAKPEQDKKKPSSDGAKAGMKPCDKPHVAESTRTKDKDDACDDGVR